MSKNKTKTTRPTFWKCYQSYQRSKNESIKLSRMLLDGNTDTRTNVYTHTQYTHMTIWEHKTSDPNENNRNLLLRPKLCAQQMQMKKSYKMKMKTYQISQNGATDSTKCMMLSFSLGINKQTNIMMKNDAQMRNQSVNHFSIIQTSNTHTHTHSQKTKNRLTARIHTHTHTF